MEDIRYSEDVKDTVGMAGKLARKANRPATNDRDYLHGLLLTHRKFNRLDALLGEMKVSANRLKSDLGAPNNDPPPAPTSDLLKNSEIIAKGSRNGAEFKSTTTVEVEDVLKALCMSADPVVSRVIRDNNISPERIDLAIQSVKRRKGQLSFLYFGRELIEVVAFVLFFLILIKSFLGELRLIPSESMVPGLQINDRLVIERASTYFRPYQRGDILVFYPPMTELRNDPWSVFLRLTGFSGLMYRKEDNIDVAYIKRLIGLPGDLVDVRKGVGVFVNGKMLDEPYVNEIANTCTQVRPESYCGPVKVPPHSYYMMGDNRNLSLDSRYWGFAREDRVIGRAVFRIWPPERMGTLPLAPYQHP